MKNNIFTEVLRNAKEMDYAVGAVNIFNYLTADAAIDAAEDAGVNIILQTSAATVKYYGAKKLFSMIDSLRIHANIKVALHLDHCRDMELGKNCIDSGWDGIMMDYSHLPLSDNIKNTLCMAEYAHKNGVAIEGEVGVISGVEEDIISNESVGANYEETVKFIKETCVDAIAPAIGTAHGVYSGVPKVDFDLVKELGKLSTPVVVHGGSGLSAETFRKLIGLGGRKINISTIVKNAYLGKTCEIAASNMAPLQFDQEVKAAVLQVIKEHLVIFMNNKK